LRNSLEPALRWGFHLYWRFARGMTLGVRAVVLDSDNRVFLVKHSYVAGWHLPGGGVEVGETFGDALRRELAEEGRIEPLGEPALHGLFFNSHVSRRDHVAVYLIRQFRGGCAAGGDDRRYALADRRSARGQNANCDLALDGVVLLRLSDQSGIKQLALVIAGNLVVNLIFFMTHPVFTPYYTIPVAMLSLWTLLFATLIPRGEAVRDSIDLRLPIKA
jgi:ADP-ribose pyrophosphatase YjhB (NUDIX family)